MILQQYCSPSSNGLSNVTYASVARRDHNVTRYRDSRRAIYPLLSPFLHLQYLRLRPTTKHYSAQCCTPALCKIVDQYTPDLPISALSLFPSSKHCILPVIPVLLSHAPGMSSCTFPITREFRPRSSRRDKGFRVYERVWSFSLCPHIRNALHGWEECGRTRARHRPYRIGPVGSRV